MDICAINFIARHWWKRVEVWVIAILLVVGGLTLGFQAGVWSSNSYQAKQLAEVRAAYDAAMGSRDLRLTKLAESTQEAASKVQEASGAAVEAAGVASKAADKVNEAVERASP